MIYRIICSILAGQPDRVDWPAFSSSDWDLLITTARAEGVAPLLYHALDTAGWPRPMPARSRCELQADYYATAAQNLLIYQELSRILTTVHNSKSETRNPKPVLSPVEVSEIPIIVLKGAALAATLYPSIGLRPMGDLDLLLPRDRLDQAITAVSRLGYVPEGPEIRPGLARLISYEANFEGGDHIPLHVELHWNLIGGEESRYQPRIDWFWSQTEPFSNTQCPISNPKSEIRNPKRRPEPVEGSEILTLTPTAHLLYLAAHLALKHGIAHSPLRWFYDIHLLVTWEGHRIDWNGLVLRAHEFRWAPALHAALAGTAARFDTPLPAGLLATLVDGSETRDQALVQRKSRPQTRWESTSDTLTSLTWRARLRLLLSIAIPSRTYMRWRYRPHPTWLWPLYYPYRWFDILCDGLRTLWQMANNRGQRRVVGKIERRTGA